LPNGPDPDVRDEIYLVALRRGVNYRVMHAMMATAIVESIVNNLDCGDQDSVGVFQQRPSKGWGTIAQIMNVEYSTTKFLDLCIVLDKQYPNLDTGELAQKVQRAEAGNKYTAQLDYAARLINLAKESTGKNGPPKGSSSSSSPRPTSTEDPDEPTSTSTRTRTSTGGANTPSSTPNATNKVPGPPTATLWSPPARGENDRSAQPSVLQVVLMPSAAVGRADPVRDASAKKADQAKVAECARAEYAKPGDGCTTFSQRFKLSLTELRKLNPTLDAECLNLDVHRAWCVEAAESDSK
jgi:hypothetical protein